MPRGYKGMALAKCHPDKPLTGNGLCKSCYYKKWYQKTPQRKAVYRKVNKAQKLKRQFGLTFEQWKKMFLAQFGRCKICGYKLKHIESYATTGFTCVDHDHITGRVRGLLCNTCNGQRVGRNTAETAKLVLAYLEVGFDGRKL